MKELEALGRRFAGVSIDFRPKAGWANPWRVRLLANKNERSDYRLTFYGSDLEAVVLMLLYRVDQLDKERQA